MKETIKEMVKWTWIIFLGTVAFYIVYPKWEFHLASRHEILNKITGLAVDVELVDQDRVGLLGLWVNKETTKKGQSLDEE